MAAGPAVAAHLTNSLCVMASTSVGVVGLMCLMYTLLLSCTPMRPRPSLPTSGVHGTSTRSGPRCTVNTSSRPAAALMAATVLPTWLADAGTSTPATRRMRSPFLKPARAAADSATTLGILTPG